MTPEEIFQQIQARLEAHDLEGARQLQPELEEACIRETGRYEPTFWIRRQIDHQNKARRKNGWFVLTSPDGGPRERFTYAEALTLYASELHRPVTLTQYTPDGQPWRYMRSRGPQESQWVRLPNGQMWRDSLASHVKVSESDTKENR